MDTVDTAEERLFTLASAVDFARRYYALAQAGSGDKADCDLPVTEVAAVLRSTGRIFELHRKERFFATREADVDGELGLNLALNGSVEFILVARGPDGHFGRAFTLLARQVAERDTPELTPPVRAPRPSYSDLADLQSVLAEGFGLYSDWAAAIKSSGLIHQGKGRSPKKMRKLSFPGG